MKAVHSPPPSTLVQASKHTHTHLNAHSVLLSHPDNLYPTAICICWAKLISFCLAGHFLLSADHRSWRLMQQLRSHMASGRVQMNRYTSAKCMHAAFPGRREEWGRGGVHTGKQTEIKDETRWGKLLCWQGAEQSLLAPLQAQGEEEARNSSGCLPVCTDGIV